MSLKMDLCAKHNHLEGQVDIVREGLTALAARIPDRLGDSIARLETKMDASAQDLRDLRTQLRADYITRLEFEPVKRLVYGSVGLILTTVLLGLLALIVFTG